jgi:hypothetical protein
VAGKLNPLPDLLHLGFILLGSFLLGCALFEMGLGIYLWLEAPKRLATQRIPGTQSLVIINPQPSQVSLNDTNIMIVEPPTAAYISGAATNAAIWVRGKAFKSGTQAAWELVRGSRWLWFLGAGTVICGRLLKRYSRTLKIRSELERSPPAD